MKKFFCLISLSFLFFSCKSSENSSSGNSYKETESLKYRGADISYLIQEEDLGIYFYKAGNKAELLDILKTAGINWIRLRLWHSPTGDEAYNDLENTLKLAKRIKKAGFNFLLDIHYSDTWADPSNQQVPKAWEGHTLAELCNDVSTYTSDLLSDFSNNECLPDMIQVGNEITNGMLFPYGKADSSNCEDLMKLVSAGCNAIRNYKSEIKIMLHLDCAYDKDKCSWWFLNAKNAFVDYDVIGLSYYPVWHESKNIDDVGETIDYLKATFEKEVCIVETSYPWTLQWNDDKNNSVGMSSQLLPEFSATDEGQKSYLKALCTLVYKNGGSGVFWWEPSDVSVPEKNRLSDAENLTWFNFACSYNGTGDVFKNFKELK